MSTTLLSAIAFSSESIPYRKELRELCGSIPATILFGQLLYWFRIKEYEEFYKFISPATGHAKYKPGDSWTEELRFSYDEFALAFSKIGFRCKTKKEYTDGGVPPDAMFYSYTDKIQGMTYWGINVELTTKKLEECYASQKSVKVKKISTALGKTSDLERNDATLANPNYPDGQTPSTEHGKPQVDIYTETTTENTTETNTPTTSADPIPFTFSYFYSSNNEANKINKANIHLTEPQKQFLAWFDSRAKSSRTERAFDLNLKKIMQYDNPALQIEVIEKATASGWRGLQDLYDSDIKKVLAKQKSQPTTTNPSNNIITDLF